MPGGLMGMLRANVPAIYVYGGTILPGRYQNKDLNIVSVFEAVGENAAGKLSDFDLKEIEKRAIPGTGSCGGMYTANTMSSAFEALGISLPYSSTMANVHEEKVESAKESARVLVQAIRKGIKPRDIVTRKSIENAVAVIMATGCCTSWPLRIAPAWSGPSTILSASASARPCCVTSSPAAKPWPWTCMWPAAFPKS
jgi:dihydroxy-acid dehydratase